MSNLQPPASSLQPGAPGAPGRCRCQTEVYSRVVGYYRPVQQFNPGMEAMYKDRVFFKVDSKEFDPTPNPQPQNPSRSGSHA